MGTLVSTATLSSFRVPVTPIAVPRRTVYRFRVPADRDLSDVLDRLTEGHVQVLEIRRCPEPPGRRRGPAPDRGQEPVPHAGAATRSADGVVVPLRVVHRPLRPGPGTAEEPSAG
ncbi:MULTISPECIES: hypothetical protein [unclassified Geodermatophilus]